MANSSKGKKANKGKTGAAKHGVPTRGIDRSPKETKAGGGRGSASTSKAAAPAQENPYGGVPSGGITYPPYYRPTASLKSNNNYFPGTEQLASNEMRISFLGSTPFPPTLSQAGTCIMVELGDGKRFFFDFGSGCMRNLIAMQVPVQMVNDIFLTHLHVDHYADLPYMQAFAPWMGRWKPLRVHGASGRTAKDGVKYMIEGMQQMMHWHTDSFNSFPIGDGYEIEVNEFDFRDDNGICYDKDGVVVRHWRRSHTKDGAVAYRLDWNGLSFVWTGDGRPDDLTAKYAKGVDVFVTELQPDLGNLTSLKYGTPALMTNVTIDGAHTVHYATGYLFNQVKPRLAMCTHLTYDEMEVPEIVAGIRTHWKGLFQFGAPDVVVVNVTKDAIWTRKAALPESAMPARPGPREAIELFDLGPTRMEVRFPDPLHTIADVQERFVRDHEYSPRLYYPSDVYRKADPVFPDNFKINVLEMVGQKIQQKLEAKAGEVAGELDGKASEAEEVVEQLATALANAKSPFDLLGIVQEFGGHLNKPEVLGEILTSAKAIGELLKKAQELGKLFTQAQASGDPLGQLAGVAKALKHS